MIAASSGFNFGSVWGKRAVTKTYLTVNTNEKLVSQYIHVINRINTLIQIVKDIRGPENRSGAKFHEPKPSNVWY